MAVLAVAASMALAACEGDEPKEDTSPKPSKTSASSPAAPERSAAPSEEPSAERPSAKPPREQPSAGPSGKQTSPKTKAGAIARYEEYLRALGRGDLDTVCEVAGPAAKQAEAEGVGPCTSAFGFVLQMITSEQKTALRSATVDPQRVVVETPARIEMPVESVKASVTFTERELGDSTLEYIDGEWFITG